MVSEYVPAVHEMQTDAAAFEYVPTGQDWHKLIELAPAYATNVPAAQDVQLVCKAILYVPAIHTEHVASPFPDVYVPAAQSLQNVEN
jgi:hypothetical protein